MKRYLIALALLIGTVTAAETPPIVGTIANRAGGQIVLTMRSTSDCAKKEAVFVYTRDEGGKVSAVGCWKVDGESIWVFWADGEIYEYPAASIEWSEAWIEHIRKRKESQT